MKFKKYLILCLLLGANLTAEIPYALDSLLEFSQPSKGFVPVPFWESMKRNREETLSEFYEDKDVKTVEQTYLEFCKNYENSLKADQVSIPQIIHLIWLGSNIPEKVASCFESWKKYHPDWEIMVWTDKELADFSWSRDYVRQAFVEADTWAEKADILRIEILYKHGGIYSDADVVCLNSFQDLIVQDIGFFSSFELNYIGKHYGKPFFIGSAVMGSAKNGHVMKYCLENLKTAKDEPTVGIIKRTGPGLISRGCEAVLESGAEKVLILPCGFLYPLPWKQRVVTSETVIDFISPESLAIHLWDGSWCPPRKKK